MPLKLMPMDELLDTLEREHSELEWEQDRDWWKKATEPQQRALLDHELHHIYTSGDTDDLRRPIIEMRQHDYEFGWFRVIAERHGAASQERIQAAWMMESGGQYFWPEICGAMTAGGRASKLEVRSGR